MANGPEIAKAYVQVIPTTKGIRQSLESEMADAGTSSGSSFAGTFGKAALKGIAAATAAIGSVVMASINAGLDFDATMSEVGAISGATGEDFDALREKAQYMGATTKFSATESAEALTYMAMAGWKTEDMLGGIEGIMNLAAASGEDLALTSDIVTDALTAFGLAAEDSTHFADVLAAASSNANTNVSMLGASFKYTAPVAGALGYSVEDAAVALGLMANAGIKADTAGTALRATLTNMANPTNRMWGAMKTLGVSLTDDEGNMLSLMEVMRDLRNGFAGLTEDEAAATAANLAGKEAMSGLLAIVNASDEDFDKLTNAIYGADGAAQQMSATMQDNLQGDITIMKSAIEGFEIAVSDALTGSLREIVQFGSDSISELTMAFQSEGAEGAVKAFGEILTRGIARVIERLPEVVELATTLLGTLGRGIIDNLPLLAESAVSIITTLAADLGEALPTLIPAIVDILLQIVNTLTAPEQIGMLIDAALSLISGLEDGLLAALPELAAATPEIIRNISTGIVEHLPEIFALGIEIVLQLLDGIWDTEVQAELLFSIAELAGLLISTLIEGIRALKTKVTDFCRDVMDDIREALGLPRKGRNGGTVSALGEEMAQGIGAGFNAAMPGMYDGMAASLDDAMKMAAVQAQARLDASTSGSFAGAGGSADEMAAAVGTAVRDAMSGGMTANVYLDGYSVSQQLYDPMQLVTQQRGTQMIR